MDTKPRCPYCSHHLHAHDMCPRNVNDPASQTCITLRIQRVYCPSCGRTHRVLPDFIVPGSQLSSQDADEILVLNARNESVAKVSNAAVTPSSAYRFIAKIKQLYQACLGAAASFRDLFKRVSVSVPGSDYLKVSPDFGSFSFFLPIQPIP